MEVTFSAAFADSTKNKRIQGRRLDRSARRLRTGDGLRLNTLNVFVRLVSVLGTVGINIGIAPSWHLSCLARTSRIVMLRPPERRDFREIQAPPSGATDSVKGISRRPDFRRHFSSRPGFSQAQFGAEAAISKHCDHAAAVNFATIAVPFSAALTRVTM